MLVMFQFNMNTEYIILYLFGPCILYFFYGRKLGNPVRITGGTENIHNNCSGIYFLNTSVRQMFIY